jgi:hypothetical protein
MPPAPSFWSMSRTRASFDRYCVAAWSAFSRDAGADHDEIVGRGDPFLRFEFRDLGDVHG